MFTGRLRKKRKMKVAYFSKVYNEERLIPYVFRYYDNIVDDYYIWDHASTDRTKELLLKNPKVTVFDLPSGSFDEEENRINKNTGWVPYAKEYDWVIIVDFDEFMYHPDLLKLLEKYKNEGITIAKTDGHQMYAESFPIDDGKSQIYELVKQGRYAFNYSKFTIINPSAVVPNYSYGSHQMTPTGNVKFSETAEVKLLHYKIFGEEFINQMMERNKRLSPRNMPEKLGWYSLDPKAPHNPRLEYEAVRDQATEVI